MDFRPVTMKEETFILTNGPLVLLVAAANIFYGLSLFVNRRRLKPPVRILLGSSIWCAIVYCGSMTVIYCMPKDQLNVLVGWTIVLHCTHSSMTCCVCLTFYYNIHIVPARKALFVWIKKNIGLIVYVTLVSDIVLFTVSGAFIVVEMIHDVKGLTYNNYTHTEHREEFFYRSRTCFIIAQLYVLLGLCIMTFSSFSTVCYLQRHLRSMARSDGRLTTPLYQSQMRVTVTGIAQGLLYTLFYTQYASQSVFYIVFAKESFGILVSLTVITVYFSCSTVILGIGQATIRQSAALVLKALKVRCVIGMVAHDVSPHCSSS